MNFRRSARLVKAIPQFCEADWFLYLQWGDVSPRARRVTVTAVLVYPNAGRLTSLSPSRLLCRDDVSRRLSLC